MTRSEQEKLVERYLGGDMNSSQEEEFFIQVAVNNDLRQTLKAYRVVESAIRKHRDTVPPHHAESRARVIALLSAGAAAQPHAGSNATGVTRPMLGHLTMSASALRWIIGSVAAVGLTVGVLVVAPMMEKKTTVPPAATAPARKAEVPKFVEPPASTPEIVTGTTPPVALSEDSLSPDRGVTPPARSLRDHARPRLESQAIAARSHVRRTGLTTGAESSSVTETPDLRNIDRRRNQHPPITDKAVKLRLEIDSSGRKPSSVDGKP
ncbi:MAG: hypothetical protein JWQ98_65 [Chlorobi bacterium]|nr:hypothetical protein [Chlorobiota bacterium]